MGISYRLNGFGSIGSSSSRKILEIPTQQRFSRYIRLPSFSFLGDGEMDEPESIASIAIAGRERLDNLIVVVNCNLQRLDGPVRGNAKIIQELEGLYRGAGWNVIKVLWNHAWDKLLRVVMHASFYRG